MKYRRALFVLPPYRHSHYRATLHTGVGYLCEYLSANGVQCRVFDFALHGRMSAFVRTVGDFQPDLVGLSMMTYRYLDTYRLAGRIKNLVGSVPLVVGGAHISAFRRRAMDECTAFDYGVVHEGEDTLLALCRGDDPARIDGLLFRSGGEVRYAGDRQPVRDLDRLPWPRYEAFELSRYVDPAVNVIPIVTSRGCPNRCIYCPVPVSMGRAFRYRSAESVVDELSYWHGRGYRRFSISDDNFTHNRERVLEICRLIEQRGLRDLRISCDNGLRADRVDEELLARMKEVGFWRIAYGVDSGDDDVLKAIKKGCTVERARRAIEAATGMGYAVRLFFLIGSPGEGPEQFARSMRLAMDYPVEEASFYTLVPFPGTELESWARRTGALTSNGEYLNTASGWRNRPMIHTPEFPYRQRRKAFRQARRLRQRIVRRSLGRRLSRYGAAGRAVAWLVTTPLGEGLLKTRLARKTASHLARGMVGHVLGPEG